MRFINGSSLSTFYRRDEINRIPRCESLWWSALLRSMNYVIWLNSGRTERGIIVLETLRVLYCFYFLLLVVSIRNEPAIFQSRTTLWSHTRYVKLKSNRCLCWSSDVLRVKIVAVWRRRDIFIQTWEKMYRDIIMRNWISKLIVAYKIFNIELLSNSMIILGLQKQSISIEKLIWIFRYNIKAK